MKTIEKKIKNNIRTLYIYFRMFLPQEPLWKLHVALPSRGCFGPARCVAAYNKQPRAAGMGRVYWLQFIGAGSVTSERVGNTNRRQLQVGRATATRRRRRRRLQSASATWTCLPGDLQRISRHWLRLWLPLLRLRLRLWPWL